MGKAYLYRILINIQGIGRMKRWKQFTDKNGNKYVGEWKNDKMHGEGTSTDNRTSLFIFGATIKDLGKGLVYCRK